MEATAKIAPDRRRHRRHALDLFGRFMLEDKQEYSCRLLDISVGGAALRAPALPEIGERIVAYFDQLGGLEGKAIRAFDGGFAMQFSVTPHKREKLAAQITWLINRRDLGGVEERRHERIVLQDYASTLKLGEGHLVPCQVVDVSLSGASVSTTVRPSIGSHVELGRMRARVVRHHENGLGLEFVEVQEPEGMRRHFSGNG